MSKLIRGFGKSLRVVQHRTVNFGPELITKIILLECLSNRPHHDLGNSVFGPCLASVVVMLAVMVLKDVGHFAHCLGNYD